MFYQASLIDEILNCPQCKQKYDEPRMLPCGYSICNYCVKSLINNFTCSFCAKEHCIPHEGLPLNQIALNMMSHHPEEVYRGKEMETLKSFLSEFKTKLTQIEFDINHPDDKINDYCKELRRQVQLKTEETIHELNEINESLLYKIDDYERDCLEKIKNKKKYDADKFEEIKKLINEFQIENTRYLQVAKIDEIEIAKENEYACDLKPKLENEIDNLNAYIFDDNLIKFAANSTKINVESMIGHFYSKKFIDESKLKKIDLKSNLNDWNGNKIGHVVSLPGLVYLFVYHNRSDEMVVAFFDLIKQTMVKKIIEKSDSIFLVRKFSNMIAIDYSNENTYGRLLILNTAGDIIAMEIDFMKYLVGTSEKGLFTFDSQDNDKPLEALDSKLNKIDIDGKFQTKDPNAPFYLSANLKYIEIRDGKYYVSDENKLKILDANTGLVQNCFPISETYFEIDSKNNIIIEDSSSKKIIYYDLHGNLIKEIKLNFGVNCISGINHGSDALFFYDWDTNIFYHF